MTERGPFKEIGILEVSNGYFVTGKQGGISEQYVYEDGGAVLMTVARMMGIKCRIVIDPYPICRPCAKEGGGDA
jgi:hypothetical protein